MARLRKILIANRGEIACRILRTACALGYETVAVYSDADANAVHVSQADEAVRIGPAPASDSYLNIERILEAARLTDADAVHPGYGFLAENARFAEACAKAGLIFIGPSAASISAMGDKAEARRRMETAGVACVPGHHGTDQSDAALTAAAGRIGFPLIVKASAGGGGKGLRLVAHADDLANALARARSEAQSAFGSDALILEKVISPARHVEIQVFADRHGNVIHLGERDCSVQRRHQKVIEETPGPGITPELRARMGQAAVAAARAADYEGAGTVEFLLDTEGRFWFLEMNTRLQVEHPVTEMITRLDLVAWQIAVAEGAPLPLQQDEVTFRGHAIEARLYAEDPWDRFLPRPGRAEDVNFPDMPGVRMDTGLTGGEDVTPFYDPMVAKIIAWGESRETARRRLIRALRETQLYGIETNRSFLIEVLRHTDFAAGMATTEFLDRAFLPALKQRPSPETEDYALAALLLWLGEPGTAPVAWGGLKGWSSSGRTAFHCRFDTSGEVVPVGLEISNGAFRAEVAGTEVEIAPVEQTGDRIFYRLNGVKRSAFYRRHGPDCVTVDRNGHSFGLVNVLLSHSAGRDQAADGVVLAPMHGRIRTIHVRPGDTVSEGGPLMVLEAMKMEHDITSPVNGTVSEILVTDDQQVSGGARLVVVNTEAT